MKGPRTTDLEVSFNRLKSIGDPDSNYIVNETDIADIFMDLIVDYDIKIQTDLRDMLNSHLKEYAEENDLCPECLNEPIPITKKEGRGEVFSTTQFYEEVLVGYYCDNCQRKWEV